MRPPLFRNDINGSIPKLTQTLKEVCDYLPSMRITSHTSRVCEHRYGTTIDTRSTAQNAVYASAGDEGFTHLRLVNNIFLRGTYDDSTLYGDTFTFYGATASSYFTCYDIFGYINGAPFTATQSVFPEVSGAMAGVTSNGIFLPDAISSVMTLSDYEYDDSSWIYGALHLKCELTSGLIFEDLAGNAPPPVGYSWKVEMEARPYNFYAYSINSGNKGIFGGYGDWLFNAKKDTYYIPLADFCIYDGGGFFEACAEYQAELDSKETPEEKAEYRQQKYPIDKDNTCSVEIKNYGHTPQLMVAYTEDVLKHINEVNAALAGGLG